MIVAPTLRRSMFVALAMTMNAGCLDPATPGATPDAAPDARDGANRDAALETETADGGPDADSVEIVPDVDLPDGPEDTSSPRPCPIARMDIGPGTRVAPMTSLTLDGSMSHAPGGSIASYRWEVDQPLGARARFRPGPHIASPTFRADLAGLYTFRLTVTDANGTRSCAPATLTVEVVPGPGLHVELFWSEGSSGSGAAEPPTLGADLDLHLRHPLAAGTHDGDGDGLSDGWFDTTFDTFWYNPSPSWGRFDPSAGDDPRLLLHSSDASEPELIALTRPEPGIEYTVGVHHWNDRGLGEAAATVRIHIDGRMVFELADVVLSARDMWSVATIRWSDPPVLELMRRCEGTAMACRSDAECGGVPCGLNIVPDYAHPYFPLP